MSDLVILADIDKEVDECIMLSDIISDDKAGLKG